jgi:hypothetical protein
MAGNGHHDSSERRQKPTPRVELGTARLRIGCSTTELSRRTTPPNNDQKQKRKSQSTAIKIAMAETCNS